MRTLKFIVSGQKLSLDPAGDYTGLVAGSVGYLRARFELDRSWHGCKVAASFWRGEEEHAALVINGVCLIPAEALEERMFGVSLTGVREGYRIVTNKLYLHQEVG